MKLLMIIGSFVLTYAIMNAYGFFAGLLCIGFLMSIGALIEQQLKEDMKNHLDNDL